MIIYRKYLVIVIMTLLLGTSVVPCISENITFIKNINSNDKAEYNKMRLNQKALMIPDGKKNPIGWPLKTEVVSTDSTGHSEYTSLAVDKSGVVHVAWEDWTDYDGSGTDVDIFYSYKPKGGSWSKTEVVSTSSNLHSCNPSLAVDDVTGTVHIAWCEMLIKDLVWYGKQIVYSSKTIGGSWPVGGFEVISTEYSGDCAFRYFPSLGIEETAGKVHVAWQDNYDYSSSGLGTSIVYKSKLNYLKTKLITIFTNSRPHITAMDKKRFFTKYFVLIIWIVGMKN